MKTFKSFSLLVVLCLLVIGTIWAQEPLTVKIYATDGLKNDSLLVGINALGTNGIDLSLGEYELPPEPPTFDVRSKTYPGYSSVGLGVRTDYHKLNRANQTDIWKIGFISDESGSEVTFSWNNTGLGASGGYWMLTELDGTPLCDMTTHTNYTYPNFDVSAQHILLWRGDGAGFFTAPSETLAYQGDGKGKGKNSKGKPIAKKSNGSEGYFTFTYTWEDSVNDLHLVFSKAVDEILSIVPAGIATPTVGKKNKEWDIDFAPDWLDKNEPVTIFARTHAGKGKPAELYAKSYWWTKNGTTWPDPKAIIKDKVFANSGTEKAILPVPNWYNLIDQVYQVKYPKAAKPNGICVGTTGAIPPDSKGKTNKFFTHAKTADISKSLWKGSKAPIAQTHVSSGAAPDCMGKDKKGNALLNKVYKTWQPKTGQFNPLFAELLALKVNVEVNDAGWTGASNAGLLKTLMITAQPSDCTWMPISVDSLIKVADYYMSACAQRPSDPPVTATWLYSTISRINSTFAGVLDTESWWANGAIAKPVRNLAQTTALYRTGWSVPEPVSYGFAFRETEPYIAKLDQNYPNPFNPTTTIAFELPEDAMVTLKIYNLLGQEVETLINQEEFTEGTNEVSFDASRFASGVYYYRLIVNDGQFQQVKKMMLLK